MTNNTYLDKNLLTESYYYKVNCKTCALEVGAFGFADEQAKRAFENALLRRGLLPGDDAAHTILRTRIRGIDAYVVSDGFPRIVRSILPPAITEAGYTLDVRALAPFTGDAAAVFQAFDQGAGA